ncbi:MULTISPECIES: helix-turn-helix domain-containing protein [unclassified Streptomyces]|uniref:helix-turn-helix domain-containing protein n=1 Tax=unclassified Streptomyces TaxID=2593676 RepID=UPI00081ECF13|nr:MULTISPECIES: helix-turn-helix transcriptional regulator [unclassified Streptomyces]MYR92235.1 helix-turn-helix domain-containing protein [Streptomyces sp. SID4937]SCD29994.1 Helix-turn-helix domain-containing protein [Streptomyces sp. ScaeMP-e83]
MVNLKDLNPDASPEAAYGARLRSAREERGWRQDDLAQRIGYTGRHVSGVETCHKSPTRKFSIAVDVALGFVGTAESFEREWRKIKHGVLLQGFPEYLDLEGRAAEIRLFEVGVIPGLLQTREYAQALADGAVGRGVITREQADERVAFLMARQAALLRDVPPVLIAVLDESCILRPVGGPDVMKAQLQHLIDFAAQPHTTLQIAPYSIGERRPFNRLVNLLTLQDRSVVSYVESETQGHLDRELSSVVPLVRAYHQLQNVSLSQTDSVDSIHQHRKGTP